MALHIPRDGLRRIRRLHGRCVWLLILGLVLGALPSSATPPAHADAVPGDMVVCFLDTGGHLTCAGDSPASQQAVYDPPPLLNPQVVASSGPRQSAALEWLETRAADLVLSRHRLPASDRDAVLTWARPEAQGVLWELVVDAIRTSPSARTADQQVVVDWIAGRVEQEALAAAQQAGAEYASWAGLDLQRYRSLAASGSEEQLRSFLSADPVAYGRVGSEECSKTVCTTVDLMGGYCLYHSPDPYGDDYTGRTNQTCFTPCLGMICLPPTPAFHQLVTWGTAVATRYTQTSSYQDASAAIAAGLGAGSGLLSSAGTAAAYVLLAQFLAMDGYWFGNASMSILFGWAATTQSFMAAASGIAVAVAAVVAGIMVTIQFADQQQLPGKLAALVVGARNAQVDAAALLETDAGAQAVFEQLVAAASPEPRLDQTCDNSLIPLHLWASSQQDQATVWDPATGRPRTISTWPCLNPTPVSARAGDDPVFSVSRDGVPPLTQPSLSMKREGAPGASTLVRVAGNWFVQQVTDGASTTTARSLGLAYVDWEGHSRYVTTIRQPDGTYRFHGLTEKGLAEGAVPASCRSDGTCFESDQLQFLGSDGRRYVASLNS